MRNLTAFFILCLLFISSVSVAQKTSSTADRTAIKELLSIQQQAWSKGDIEGFMEGYWKSDSLKFFGQSGLTYGWEQTLANYKKGYPTTDHMGTLNFTIEDLTPIENDSYYVMGRYHLAREMGDAKGVFMIIFKRIDGAWKIVADMSCG